jgi:hypothetical protein
MSEEWQAAVGHLAQIHRFADEIGIDGCLVETLSIGARNGPPIGAQKGPLFCA